VWFGKAAARREGVARYGVALAGDVDAQMALAAAYREGRGVTASLATSAVWARRAADQDLAPAQNLLGGEEQVDFWLTLV